MTSPLQRQTERPVMAEINITPLVDVMLVLLIIFMITAPALMQEMTVRLPKSSIGQANTQEGVVITIMRDDLVYIDKERVPLPKFSARFAAARSRIGERPVFLKADDKVPYGKVVAVMGQIRAAGIEKVGLVVDLVQDPVSKQ